jgi:hypothetical protein
MTLCFLDNDLEPVSLRENPPAQLAVDGSYHDFFVTPWPFTYIEAEDPGREGIWI